MDHSKTGHHSKRGEVIDYVKAITRILSSRINKVKNNLTQKQAHVFLPLHDV
jgi:hypothetical protein